MEKERLRELIELFHSGTITDKDLHELKNFLNENNQDDELLSDILIGLVDDLSRPLSTETSNRMFDRISAETHDRSLAVKKSGFRFLNTYRYVAASITVLFLAIGVYFYHTNKQERAIALQDHPIRPGKSRAMVMLEDGRKIDLEAMDKNKVVQLKGYSLHKDSDGSISYVLGPHKDTAEPIYNTIVTPKGGEFKLKLPDGTQIWVNASSKLKYPLNFGEKTRRVELAGEAYFEVQKMKVGTTQLPFAVETGQQTLIVLGTRFNVNSYHEVVKTTLVEGAVQLDFVGSPSKRLKPNEQAVYDQTRQRVTFSMVDPFYTIAWKNGDFAFDNTGIDEVMETLSRWYDTTFEVDEAIKGRRFSGTISKYDDIYQVLKAIALTNSVRFKVEGRRIMVMN